MPCILSHLHPCNSLIGFLISTLPPSPLLDMAARKFLKKCKSDHDPPLFRPYKGFSYHSTCKPSLTAALRLQDPALIYCSVPRLGSAIMARRPPCYSSHWLTPASGPLHLLFPLLAMCFLQTPKYLSLPPPWQLFRGLTWDPYLK